MANYTDDTTGSPGVCGQTRWSVPTPVGPMVVSLWCAILMQTELACIGRTTYVTILGENVLERTCSCMSIMSAAGNAERSVVVANPNTRSSTLETVWGGVFMTDQDSQMVSTGARELADAERSRYLDLLSVSLAADAQQGGEAAAAAARHGDLLKILTTPSTSAEQRLAKWMQDALQV